MAVLRHPLANIKTTVPSDTSFSAILARHRISTTSYDDYYLQAGAIQAVQGWIFHISAIKPQIPKLLQNIVPLLKKWKIPFRIAKNDAIATKILSGAIGYEYVGKIIKIYPESEQQSIDFLPYLIDATKDIKGPAVPTDQHLGGAVYVRYGAFNPVLQLDEFGKMQRYLYNGKGELEKDEYIVPFKLARGRAWPFADFASVHTVGITGVIRNGKYLVTQVIKNDAKGSVEKGLFIDGLRIRKCLIKEGKHHMSYDSHGRDIQDRLTWQYKVQSILAKSGVAPLPIDLFTEHGNTYFVMEYIQGKNIFECVKEVRDGRHWTDLDGPTRTLLVGYAVKTIAIIRALHAHNIVHRDISPGNFIVKKDGSLVAIDLELAFGTDTAQPYPPYQYGTLGYVAPEQDDDKRLPAKTVDLYGVGALMLHIIGGIVPTRIKTSNPEELTSSIMFLTRDAHFAAVVTNSILSDPAARPSLDELEACVTGLANRTEMAHLRESPQLSPPDNHTIVSLIAAYNHVITGAPFVSPEKLWLSNDNDREKITVNRKTAQKFNLGYADGIAGVLYYVAKCQALDLSNRSLDHVFSTNLTWACDSIRQKKETSLIGGLYYGATGLALALGEGIKSKRYQSPSQKTQTILQRCLYAPCQGYSLASGSAGQGLAILHSLALVDDPNSAMTEVQKIATEITTAYTSDPIWKKHTGGNLGLARGTSGILLFLARYAEQANDYDVQRTFLNSTNILSKIAGKILKSVVDRDQYGMDDGYSGMALVFLRAFEITGVETHAQLAKDLLFLASERPLENNYTISNGVSGLGEVLLEAYRMTNDSDYLVRAAWISHYLSNMRIRVGAENAYWGMPSGAIPTAELMTGNSGMAHFILRLHNPSTSILLPI